jgi:type II secretory pathway pseudopilin PulG
MQRPKSAGSTGGFTIVELVVSIVVFTTIAVSFLGLYTSLIKSTIIAKRQAVATTLATNQMEYLKSLPYDTLAIAGGSIYATSPLPATVTKVQDGVKYTITNSISYADDAYDGCAAYPTQALKELYCRNYPPPTGSPTTDTNPQDYKVAHVTVTDKNNVRLAEVDTQISARVSETASTTGALFVSIIDNNGNKISGATVNVVNTTITPNANVSDTTDSNGTAIFYGLPPDNGTDYHVTASKSGYSSLTTIIASGSLQPTYPSQKIITQQSSYVTLTIKQQGAYSLLAEAVDTTGAPINNLKVYAKGGYKKYTLTTDTAYYYDNFTPTDSRPTTDSNGNFVIQNLVPGAYIFCGDNAATNCKVGNTTYYLVAAVPYVGTNPFNPINVPTYDAASPPTTTFAFSGNNYIQKVRLIFSTQSSFPRVTSITPSNTSLASGPLNPFTFAVNGTNLPCSSTASSCGTTIRFLKGASTYTASCTGTSGTLINCTANLTGITAGNTQMVVTANGYTLTTPADPLIGGAIVLP